MFSFKEYHDEKLLNELNLIPKSVKNFFGNEWDSLKQGYKADKEALGNTVDSFKTFGKEIYGGASSGIQYLKNLFTKRTNPTTTPATTTPATTTPATTTPATTTPATTTPATTTPTTSSSSSPKNNVQTTLTTPGLAREIVGLLFVFKSQLKELSDTKEDDLKYINKRIFDSKYLNLLMFAMNRTAHGKKGRMIEKNKKNLKMST